MSNPLPDPELTDLATGVTVRDYTRRDGPQQRQDGRCYPKTIRGTMPGTGDEFEAQARLHDEAISCLMIEALHHFGKDGQTAGTRVPIISETLVLRCKASGISRAQSTVKMFRNAACNSASF